MADVMRLPLGVAQNSPRPTQSCKWSAETQVLDFQDRILTADLNTVLANTA